MKFNLWTFFFQILNFAVLLFILKRLLFKPIREIMKNRRRMISDTLSEADNAKQEAENLSKDLKEEVLRQKHLRKEAETRMRREVEEERGRLITAAREDAEKIIEKERALFETEKKKFEDALRVKAVEAVSIYAENILKDVSDEDLQRSIVRKFQAEVKAVASDIYGTLRPTSTPALMVSTAYPLQEHEQGSLRNAFETNLGTSASLSFETDPVLIAGIVVRAGDKVYDFSLQGQIQTYRSKLDDRDRRE